MIFQKKWQSDYRTVFDSPQGRKVLADLCQRHFVFNSTHIPNDPYTSAFQDGRRSVVVDILRYVKIDLETLETQMERPYE